MPTTHQRNVKSDIDKDSIQQQTIGRFFWLRSNFTYCLLISALLWGAAVCYYIENFIGWSSVMALTPPDFAFLIIAVVVPLFLLWFLLAYIERSSSLDANAQLFRDYINNLMYPNSDASETAQAFSIVLQKQIQQLQKENKEIIEQSTKLKTDLDNRVSELSDILKLLDEYSANTLTELNNGVKSLADRCSYITDKTTNSANRLKDCTSELVDSSDKFLSKMSPILDEISAMSSNIKGNIVDNKTYLSAIKEQLSNCSDLGQQYIRDMLYKTDENSRKIEKSFYKAAEEYDALYKRLDTSISSVESRVEEQKRLIQTQTQVISHNSELIDAKLSKYGRTVSSEIDKLVKNSMELEKMTKKQISALRAVNSETNTSISSINNAFDGKRAEIERHCEYAVNSMQNVIIAINKETEKLMSFTNMTQAKNYDLQNISETIVDKIGDISNKLALKTDALKDKAVEVIDKFTEANELIIKSTDRINTSSNLVLDNNQQSVKLLEEQNFYINNAINNMDVVREKLDKLRSDITETSTDITKNLTKYEQQIDKAPLKIDPLEPEFDREKLLSIAKGINRTLRKLNVNPEKFYEKQDIFELWENYLSGKQNAFTTVLSRSLSHKLTTVIRKAFDDNAEFHSQVIRYLFLMDIIIKEMLNPEGTNRDELINLSVNASLDKIYFILVKALNNTD